MKLNPDCIRAVMLEIEKSWKLETDYKGNIRMGTLDINTLYEALPNFDKKDIFYSLYNLHQAEYLELSIFWADGGVAYDCTVNYMTFTGHQFLDKIRDTQNWSKVKKGLDVVRNYSLDAITALAEGIANAAIAAALKESLS